MEGRGPRFHREPGQSLEFLNTSGGKISCSASGKPEPTIGWIKEDGSGINGDTSSLRTVRDDGSLIFRPFSASEYRQDIHSAFYKCLATNSFGTIESHPVKVRASEL